MITILAILVFLLFLNALFVTPLKAESLGLNIVCQISDDVSFHIKDVGPNHLIVAGYTYRGAELGNLGVCKYSQIGRTNLMILECEDQNIEYFFKLIYPKETDQQKFEILIDNSANYSQNESLSPCFNQ
ncbi:MAG: hypothetical protein IPK04_18155 [Bdellovibrionales bacterium]|nr:hypothetical protein [Bdellovibrionales bacterium]